MNPIYIVLIVIGALLLLATALYLFAIKPRRKRKEMDKFKGYRFAHRGFHGEGAEENSLTAFENAIKRDTVLKLTYAFPRMESLWYSMTKPLKECAELIKEWWI